MNSILQYVDPNRRLDSVFGDAKKIANEHGQRVASIALPFLSLHSNGQIVVAIGMGSHQIATHALALKEHYSKREWRAIGADAGKIALVASSIAFTIIFPMVQFAVSNAYTIASRTGMLVIHVYRREWKEGAKDIAALIHCAVHVASVWYGTAGWVALSVLSQAGLELYSSYDEYANKKHWPEAMASAALAAIRVYKAKPQLETAYRNHFGIQMTQEMWDGLIWNTRFQDRNDTVDVESVLIKNGISSHISNLRMASGNSYNGFLIKNLFFSNCDFSGAVFKNTIISKASMDSCLFERAFWIDSVVQDCRFSRCNFYDALIVRSSFNRVTIKDSDLSLCNWDDSILDRVSIVGSKLFETVFLTCQVANGLLKGCDLTDCLLLDAKAGFTIQGGKPHVVTRPIVGVLWHFEDQGTFTNYIEKTLRMHGTIPLRYEMYRSDIDEDRLFREVREILVDIKRPYPQSIQTLATTVSNRVPAARGIVRGILSEIKRLSSSSDQIFATEILEQASSDSEIAKFKKKAESVMQYCDGFSLPGGEDIEPELYDRSGDRWKRYADYRRSLTEISILSAAEKTGTPVMGTCRGSQMINVYFGGTLFQDLRGHCVGRQECELTDSSRKEWLQMRLEGNKLISYSLHHQGADRIGENLEVLLANRSIPKLMISKNNQFIASQVHPEIHFPLLRMEDGFTVEQWGYEEWMLAAKQNEALYRLFLDQIHRFRSGEK